jgi:hypothetical protein
MRPEKGKRQMAFIVQKAFTVQFPRMRGLLIFGSGLVLVAAMMSPDSAFARETDQNESANCIDPKHRHTVLRPLTERLPLRKAEKVRVRRILM